MTPSPQIRATVRFDVLDTDGQVERTITPAEPGSLSCRDGVRSIRGVEMWPGTLFDPYDNRLQPMWVEDGTETSLGIFMAVSGVDRWTSYQTDIGTTAVGYVQTWDLQDLTARLDVPLTTSVGLAQGDTVRPLIVTLLEAAGFAEHDVAFFASGVVEPTVWEQGKDSTLDAINSMMKTVGGRFYFTAAGVPTAEATPAPEDLIVDKTYDTGAGLVLDPPEYGNQPISPNRWEAVGGTDTSPLVGTYVLPSSAPNSLANRQFTVLRRFDVAATDQPTADAAAQAGAVEDFASAVPLSFTSIVDPAAGAWDVLSVDGGLYVESGWGMDLKGDTVMSHTAGQVFVP